MKNLYIVTKRLENNYKKVILIDEPIDKIKKLYSGTTVKIDRITEIKEVTKEELSQLILLNNMNKFPYGLIIDKHYILCEELTLYSIIDYENKSLNISNLIKYFLEKNIRTKIHINNICIFSTESILLNDNIIPLEFRNGLHTKNRTDITSIIEAIRNSSNKLLNMSYSSGKFIYCTNALTGEKSLSYNLLRHAGSIWALINAKDYINDENLESKLDNFINYLLNNYMFKLRNKAYLYRNEKKDGFSIGSCGLMLLVLTDYQLHFNNDKYLDLAKEFGNGIVSMQQPNGHFFQLYDNNLELKSQFECEYYVGETMLGLVKLYKITKEEKYLDSILDALDYYISTGFEKYSDHWMTYTLSELIEIIPDNKIIEFAIKHVSPLQRPRFNPTRLESNVQLYRFYKYINENKLSNELIEEFPIEQVESNVNYYLKSLMSYYIDEETSIYMKDIDRAKYGFFCPTDNNRLRIDDIQHSIMGLIYYCKYCEKE